MTVDLLVVSYNSREHIQNLLETLNEDYEEGVWNLYVQDNGSEDGSRDWLIDHAEQYRICHVEASENVGYAKAVNHLASISDSEILAAINADTWFTTNHVKQMLRSFEEHPEQAICGPKQMDKNNLIRHGGIFWNGRGTGNPLHRGWGESDPYNVLYKDRQRCWTVSGSLYYVRRNVWDTLRKNKAYKEIAPDATGAFLPTPHFFEETFCSVHAQYLGFEVWYDGTIETAGHAWGGSQSPHVSSQQHFQNSKQMYIRACDYIGIPHEC